jgi:hypothetical protein
MNLVTQLTELNVAWETGDHPELVIIQNSSDSIINIIVLSVKRVALRLRPGESFPKISWSSYVCVCVLVVHNRVKIPAELFLTPYVNDVIGAK